MKLSVTISVSEEILVSVKLQHNIPVICQNIIVKMTLFTVSQSVKIYNFLSLLCPENTIAEF